MIPRVDVRPGCRARLWKTARRCLVAALLLSVPATAAAAPVLIDFETLIDLDDLATVSPVSGVVFSSGTVLAAVGGGGCCLNEFDFPPKSDFNVALDAIIDAVTDPFNPVIVGGGPIFLTFSAPISSFSAWFTYNLTVSAALSVQAYSDAAGTVLVDSVASAGAANLGTNEQLSVAAASIRSVRVSGDPLGSSFTMDDVEFDPVATAPEPASLLLLGAGVLTVLRRQLRRNV